MQANDLRNPLPTDNTQVKQGFEKDCVLLRMDQLLPGKVLSKAIRSSRKYAQIMASVGEVGLVEPPVVARNPESTGFFFVLDGHLRIEVLKDLGHTEVECLVSTDDEAFTYNRQVNRLAAVQEHAMIVNALNQGVPEEKIAKALSVDVSTIRRRSRMLNGVCDEARELLKAKNCPMAMFEILKKMQPLRQIEAADLMINANNFTVAYASAILAGTPQSELAQPNKPKTLKGMTSDAIARMEKEMSRLQENTAAVQETYAKDHLELTVVKRYLARLLENERIFDYLRTNRPEYLPEFQHIVEINSGMSSEN